MDRQGGNNLHPEALSGSVSCRKCTKLVAALKSIQELAEWSAPNVYEAATEALREAGEES